MSKDNLSENSANCGVNEIKPDDGSSEKKPKKAHKKLSKGTIWTIKITIITLCLAFVVSFATEITSSKSKAKEYNSLTIVLNL